MPSRFSLPPPPPLCTLITLCPSDKQALEHSRVQGQQHRRWQRPRTDSKREAHPRRQTTGAGARNVGPLRLPEGVQHRRPRAVGEELDHGQAQSLTRYRGWIKRVRVRRSTSVGSTNGQVWSDEARAVPVTEGVDSFWKKITVPRVGFSEGGPKQNSASTAALFRMCSHNRTEGSVLLTAHIPQTTASVRYSIYIRYATSQH